MRTVDVEAMNVDRLFKKYDYSATADLVVVRFQNKVIVSEWRPAATSPKGTGRTMNPSTRSLRLLAQGDFLYHNL
jgi:hypothetical protein